MVKKNNYTVYIYTEIYNKMSFISKKGRFKDINLFYTVIDCKLNIFDKNC